MFETRLTIVLTLSDRLMELLESSVPRLEKRVRNAVKREVGAHVQQEMTVAIESVDVSGGGERPAPSPAAERPAPAPSAPSQKPDEAVPAKSLPVETRAIMDATRRRLLGDDYKQKAAVDAEVKALTTAINRRFIEIAQIYGAARPTEIADEAVMEKFRADCEALTLAGNGTITTAEAPF